MEQAWLFDTLAVTMAEIDFVDPAVESEPDARERGVRLEIRPLEALPDGSVYVSPTVTMRPAICRIDLLESRPGAADRMHWHPAMADGEPGGRVFDPAMPHDAMGWLARKLEQVDTLLEGAGVEDASRHASDVAAIAECSAEIVASARSAMESAQRPWPAVTHDSRGMATT
jgi:hypothetical protein